MNGAKPAFRYQLPRGLSDGEAKAHQGAVDHPVTHSVDQRRQEGHQDEQGECLDHLLDYRCEERSVQPDEHYRRAGDLDPQGSGVEQASRLVEGFGYRSQRRDPNHQAEPRRDQGAPEVGKTASPPGLRVTSVEIDE